MMSRTVLGLTLTAVLGFLRQGSAQDVPPPQPEAGQPSAASNPQSADEANGRRGEQTLRPSPGDAGGSGADSSARVVLGVQLKAGTPQGVPVKAVQLGSAAQAAGLRTGDLLLKIDESDITEPRDVTTVLSDYAPGDEVSITLRREGKEVITTAVLATPQAPTGRDSAEQTDLETSRTPTLDEPAVRRESAESLPALKGGWLGIAVNQEPSDITGVRVKRIYPGGPAARAGIRKDDVLLQVNGQTLKEHGHLAEALAETKPGDEVSIVLTRGPNPELNKEERTVRLGDGGATQRRPIAEDETERESASYWEDSQGFASEISPASYEIEHQRRLAEQNERLERMLESLTAEVSALREEVRSLKESPSAR